VCRLSLERKQFFFEKKNQKTFIVTLLESFMKTKGVGAASRKKSFASFLQKRRLPCFTVFSPAPCATGPGQHRVRQGK
jgi:hypothetical protein